MDQIMFLFCSLLSSIVSISLLFQFMNGNYERVFKSRYLYAGSAAVLILALTGVNMLQHSVLNLATWLLIAGVAPFLLYYENKGKARRRIIECEALAVYLTVCESLGAVFLQWILYLFGIRFEDPLVCYCLGAFFSQIFVIFLYYMGASRLIKKRTFPLSKSQYFIYVIMLIYSLGNLLLIPKEFIKRTTDYMWMANMSGIILADLYLFYYIKMSHDKSYYENQIKILKHHAQIQYEYYLSQHEKYNRTLQILHDVNKHIKTIEELYRTNQNELAAEYTKQISDKLKPLIPVKYTGNPILDILLTDKASAMKGKGIDFQVEIDNVDLSRIEPIDITTIFGNLLDNAMGASEKSGDDKYVYVKIGAYHQMILVKVENNSDEVKWKNGMPVSEKGKDRGLGLLNVQRCISKYDGDIKMKWEDQKFIVNLFLNH